MNFPLLVLWYKKCVLNFQNTFSYIFFSAFRVARVLPTTSKYHQIYTTFFNSDYNDLFWLNFYLE